MKDSWAAKGACVGKDPEAWSAGNFEHLKVVRWAQTVCDTCPVFIECELNATSDDLKYVVTAGRMPFTQVLNERGRPSIEKMLKDGQCTSGHPILSDDDLRFGRCALCIGEKEQRAVAAEANRKLTNAEKTHCKWGHPFDEENVYFESRRDPKTGEQSQYRRCRKCRTYRSRMSDYRLGKTSVRPDRIPA